MGQVREKSVPSWLFLLFAVLVHYHSWSKWKLENNLRKVVIRKWHGTAGRKRGKMRRGDDKKSNLFSEVCACGMRGKNQTTKRPFTTTL